MYMRYYADAENKTYKTHRNISNKVEVKIQKIQKSAQIAPRWMAVVDGDPKGWLETREETAASMDTGYYYNLIVQNHAFKSTFGLVDQSDSGSPLP